MKKKIWSTRSAGSTALAAASLLSPLMLHAAPSTSLPLCGENWQQQQSTWQLSVLTQALSAVTASPTSRSTLKPYRFHDDHILGTSLDIIAIARSEAAAQHAVNAAKAKISELDKLLSAYRSDSELNALNNASSTVVSQHTFNVVQACEKWRNETNHAFSGRLGALLHAWHTASQEGKALSPEQLNAMITATEQANAADVKLDAATRTITRPEGVVFALDALAKGYIIDEALKAARQSHSQVSGLMIDIGGDVRFWGQSPQSDGWRVGIADPFHPADNATPALTLKINNKAIATSGKGARDYVVAGQAYSHILSPQSGLPVEKIVRATVVADTTADADALATAFTVLAPEQSLKLANRLSGVETLLMTDDGHYFSSEGWEALTDTPSGYDVSTAGMIYASSAPQASMDTASGAASVWPAGFALTFDYEVPKIEADIYRSPYVAIWITDENKQLVRTLSLLGNQQKYLNENYVWWRRYGRKMNNLDTITKPTRKPGKYSVVWDGVDDAGKPVPQGQYTLHIEAIREHGGHTYQSFEIPVSAKSFTKNAPAKDELGNLDVRFGKGKQDGQHAL